MNNTSKANFQTFATSINLKLEFASPNKNEGYLSLFSYEGENIREHCMYLYGENQFDTAWEYEYHDFLTIGRKLLSEHDKILVLGSGDLMNHRFLGKYSVDLIDIDPFMTGLATSHPLMLGLNKYSPSLNYTIHNRDAVDFIEKNPVRLTEYRYIVIDFPVMLSPVIDEVKKFGLEKFFSKEIFVGILLKNLRGDGLITMQADDTIVHQEHKKYFEELIEGTGVFFHIYSIEFEGTSLSQYFYMFTKDSKLYEYFKDNIHSIRAKPGLFRKDDYFTDLFHEFEHKNMSYHEYLQILSQ